MDYRNIVRTTRFGRTLMAGVFAVLIISSFAFFSCKKQDPLTGFESIGLPQDLTLETADLSIVGTLKQPDPVLLDRTTIYSLPRTSFTTYDPWDNRKTSFTGVSLIDLLDYLGLEETAETVRITAWNGYEIPIRVQDLRRYEYILAYIIDDRVLGESEEIKNKGLFVIAINFDGNREIDIEIYKNQLVWQVKTIFVDPLPTTDRSPSMET